jgi:F5/8 type C domain
MRRWFVNQGLTLVFAIVCLIGGLAGGCNQLLDITSITAADGSVVVEGSGGNNGSGGNDGSGGNNGSGGSDGSGGNNGTGGKDAGVVKDGPVINDGGVVDLANDHQAASGNNFCDRMFWKATASVQGGGAGPPGAIDGDLATRWSTARYQDGTDWYQVNFGGPVKLTRITLDNTMIQPDNYPGNYELYGSSNGTTFGGTPIATGAGSTNTTVINFPQVTVSAVKIKQVGTANSMHWWGICEFQVACQL